MAVGVRQMRDSIELAMKNLLEYNMPEDVKEAFNEWIEGREDADASVKASAKVVKALENFTPACKHCAAVVKEIKEKKDFLVKKSIWILGGDGWAYDIGYGGLDHILASGENLNILVLDTEVYSNTGGQSSKSTPKGAIAKFSAKGKTTHKKDLALMATTYKDVYVAKVAIGADMNQFLTAVKEAESYNGVSLIIAYAPCIEHGIDMSNSILEENRAVKSGYWHLWRYNPALIEENKSPYILDSPKPTMSYEEFLMGENRYRQLSKKDAELAKKLFNEAQIRSEETYNLLKKLSENN